MNDLSNVLDTDTIAALATAPGRGGIGVIRLSGKKAAAIGEIILGSLPKARLAYYGSFYEKADIDEEKTIVDNGIALYFPGPHSFTGEDVVELQAHGGPILLDCLLKEVVRLGARLARPGEFSERAFLNNKIDLAQAEAIADLIDSASEQAARNALRSLQGEFSQKINDLVQQLIHLRVYVEAAIDFPEEEIDFLADGKVAQDLENILQQIDRVFAEAQQGALIREGMTVVIAGKPNAGKSSLLNALAGKQSAIVTDIAGTTRDILSEHIQIDGLPIKIIDTAGLRQSDDIVEQEGIKRAWDEINKADRILLVVDSQDHAIHNTDNLHAHEYLSDQQHPALAELIEQKNKLTIINNKSDLSGLSISINNDSTIINLAAKTQQGIDLLRQHLKDCMGFSGAGEGGFTARRRHIEALERAKSSLLTGQQQLQTMGAGELLAEDLRASQNALSEITGEYSPDDLLGEIFSSFCIGK